MAEAGSQPARPSSDRSALSWASRSAPLLIASIAVVTAVGAYLAVRAFVPVRASGIVPATLTVDTQPPGAALLIDRQARGTTPVAFAIEPGVHTVAVRAGGVERTVQLTLAAGAQVAQYFDLTVNPPTATPGRLSIVTDPPGVRVIVDGRPRGVSPLMIDDLTAAEHVVSVTSDAGSAQRTIAVTDGVTKEVVFALPRSTSPAAGWVSVTSPFPVELVERDEVVGTSGTAKIMLPAGRHDVVLRNQSVGYEAARTIDVTAGRVASVKVSAPEGRLNVNARPWADVLIDGVPAGQTPMANIALPIGPHQITFRHPQFGERTERVVITATSVNRVSVDLGK